MICVSHDVNLASRFADELILMRDGEILAAGSPAEVVNEEILSRVYDVQIELITTADSSTPLIKAL